MNWYEPVDLYCERLGPGLWDEPLNAVSNLAFIAAGLWLLPALRRTFAPGPAPPSFRALAWMIILIGLCSGLFHLFGTRGTEVLDIASIALFIHFYMVCFARHALGAGWHWAWLAAPAFVGFSALVKLPFAAGAFNGSVVYLPPLAGLVVLGSLLALRRQAGAALMFAAVATLCVSITLRSLDLALCARWPWGTHWAWHSINGVMLALVTLALARAARARA